MKKNDNYSTICIFFNVSIMTWRNSENREICAMPRFQTITFTSESGMYHLSWKVNLSPLFVALYLAQTSTSLNKNRCRNFRTPS